ncbi:hypothetical protein HDF26_000284 [Pedobacter cryoconitis]|uniref:hypothetical protein n=1 Tax=Pedobacter cryoconitis TaxID=188932 RepID=UPI00160725EA|nr:hypothetical protein [Pedobacter cryoconitis]MBB6269857.1 hypothetical protein [Pedobacter cryoconitis]
MKIYLIPLFIAGMMTVSGCSKTQFSDLPPKPPIDKEPGGGMPPVVNPKNSDPLLSGFSIPLNYLNSTHDKLLAKSDPTNFTGIFSVQSPTGASIACWATVVVTNGNTVITELSQKYQFTTDGSPSKYQDKSLDCKISQSDIVSGNEIGLKLDFFNSEGIQKTIFSTQRYQITKTDNPTIPTDPNKPIPVMADIPENAKYVRPGTHGVNTVLARNGNYHLDFQSDGNLVLYGANYDPLWHSKTMDFGGYSNLKIDQNGTMHISGNGKWIGGTSYSPLIGIWVLQDDGNLVCYEGSVDKNGRVTTWGEPLGATMTQGGIGSRHQGKFI